MTFLREPVDRVLSHYYRHVHRNKQKMSLARRQRRLESGKGRAGKADSIEEALVEMRLPQLSNLATRFLCGHPSSPMAGDLPASALDDAKESLREFAFVGIQERFEESIVLLQRMLGLGSIPYRDRHVSSDRPAVDEIPDAERALIEEHNQLDAELYRFGLGLFEDAVAAADDGFTAAVEKLRAEAQPPVKTNGASPSRPFEEAVREEIDALADRYELTEGAADALQGLVRLVDWGETNFVPKSDQSSRERQKRRAGGSETRVASSMLAESLAGLELEPVRAARRLADIGSGAGFPGLVLAVALPRARVTLIEKVPEKCTFLRRAVAELGLDNVDVVEGYVQQWSEGVGTCDVVTSRKVGRPHVMVERSAPLLAPGGAIALWPGPTDFSREAAEAAADAAGPAGLRLAQVHPLHGENHRGKRVVKHLLLYLDVGES